MATRLYTQDDNGNLKFVAEADATVEQAPLIVDALLDENPRIQHREFVALDEDAMVTVTVENDEPVNPRRQITLGGGSGKVAARPQQRSGGSSRRSSGGSKASGGNKRSGGSRRSSGGSKSGSKRGGKPAAKKQAAKSSGSKPRVKTSAFKRNAASEE